MEKKESTPEESRLSSQAGPAADQGKIADALTDEELDEVSGGNTSTGQATGRRVYMPIEFWTPVAQSSPVTI
jgi:hypothetical protein